MCRLWEKKHNGHADWRENSRTGLEESSSLVLLYFWWRQPVVWKKRELTLHTVASNSPVERALVSCRVNCVCVYWGMYKSVWLFHSALMDYVQWLEVSWGTRASSWDVGVFDDRHSHLMDASVCMFLSQLAVHGAKRGTRADRPLWLMGLVAHASPLLRQLTSFKAIALSVQLKSPSKLKLLRHSLAQFQLSINVSILFLRKFSPSFTTPGHDISFYLTYEIKDRQKEPPASISSSSVAVPVSDSGKKKEKTEKYFEVELRELGKTINSWVLLIGKLEFVTSFETVENFGGE